MHLQLHDFRLGIPNRQLPYPYFQSNANRAPQKRYHLFPLFFPALHLPLVISHTIRPLFLQGLQAVWQVTTEESHKPVLKGKFASFDGIAFAALLRILINFKAVSYNSINRDMYDNCRNVINKVRMLSLFVNRVHDQLEAHMNVLN